MWEIDYSDEVKFYFLDNYPYTFDLLVKIEELKFAIDGLPDSNYRLTEAGYYWWEVLDHIVIYRLRPAIKQIRIFAIKPNE
jgi:hypothetical protein